MAIYHTRVKTFSRANGHSSTAAAAYRAGLLIIDERTGIHHDYRRRGGVIETRCFAPLESPVWAMDPQALWSGAEAREGRKDSTVAREFEVSLPHELSDEQRSELVANICRELVGRYGFAIQASIHEPPTDEGLNFHAHILATTRRMRPQGLMDKTRELDGGSSGRTEVEWVREMIAERINASLDEANIDARVDHRTLVAQSADAADRGDFVAAAMLAREPTKTVSKDAMALSRRGIDTEPVRKNKAIKAANEAAFEALVAEFSQQGRLIPTSVGHSHVQARNEQRARAPDRQEVAKLAMSDAARIWLDEFAQHFHETMLSTTKLIRHQAQRVAQFAHDGLFTAYARDLVRMLKLLKQDVSRFDRRMDAEDRASHLRSQAQNELERFDSQHPHPGLWTKREWAQRRRRRLAALDARARAHELTQEATGPQAQRDYQTRVQASSQSVEQLSQAMLKRYPVEEDAEAIEVIDEPTLPSVEAIVSKKRSIGPK